MYEVRTVRLFGIRGARRVVTRNKRKRRRRAVVRWMRQGWKKSLINERFVNCTKKKTVHGRVVRDAARWAGGRLFQTTTRGCYRRREVELGNAERVTPVENAVRNQCRKRRFFKTTFTVKRKTKIISFYRADLVFLFYFYFLWPSSTGYANWQKHTKRKSRSSLIVVLSSVLSHHARTAFNGFLKYANERSQNRIQTIKKY